SVAVLRASGDRPARIDEPPAALNGLDAAGRLLPTTRGARPPRLVFLLPITNHAGIENDVGVQDFARQRVSSRRSHGETHVGGDLAVGAVAEVIVFVVVVILIVNLVWVVESSHLVVHV